MVRYVGLLVILQAMLMRAKAHPEHHGWSVTILLRQRSHSGRRLTNRPPLARTRAPCVTKAVVCSAKATSVANRYGSRNAGSNRAKLRRPPRPWHSKLYGFDTFPQFGDVRSPVEFVGDPTHPQGCGPSAWSAARLRAGQKPAPASHASANRECERQCVFDDWLTRPTRRGCN